MNAATLRILIEKGLSPEDILAVAEAMESKKDNTNAERQARFRERRKQAKQTRYSNGVTPPIDITHTPKTISPDGENETDRDVLAVRDCWNEVAKAHGLATCSKISGKRLTACRARLKDDGLGAIQQAIKHIPRSSFLLGKTGNWSGATINFLLKPESVTKILEGQYDDRTNRSQAAGFSAQVSDKRSSLARAIDEGVEFLGG